jgi:hypothetical protein
MTETHVVSALREKRAELSGEVRKIEKTLHRLKVMLQSIDNTIRVFSPDLDPATIEPKRPRHRSGLFKQGELPRLCADQLRASDGPISAQDMMHAICAAKGIQLSSEVTERVLTIMRTMLKRGEVTRHGEAPHVVWMLTTDGHREDTKAGK